MTSREAATRESRWPAGNMLWTSRPKLHAPRRSFPLGRAGSNVVSSGASMTL
jgi:hypothetical protein